MRRVTAIFAVLGILACSQPASAVDASAAWNSICTGYNFARYPMGGETTFAEAYSGGSFSSDFAAIQNAVNSTLSITGGSKSGSDLFNASIENW